MSKAGKALKAMWWIVRKPVLLNRVLDDADSWEAYVKKKYPFGEGLPQIGMEQVVKDEHASLGPMSFLDGGSLPTDMMLLAGLAGGIPDCAYFEIGTWRGESAATVAPRAKSIHSLSLGDEEMRAMGLHERTIGQHRMFSEKLENVVHLRGNSKHFDFAGLGKKFDLIFIDGDHHYDAIVSDTRNVFSHLVHEKSIVVWHDYGYHPDTIRYEVMAAILDGAGEERTGRIYQVAHTKAAIFTGTEFEAADPEFPAIPTEYYSLELSRHHVREDKSV